MARLGGDRHLGSPIAVQAIGQPSDDIQIVGILIHQGQRAAPQTGTAHQGSQGIFTERGAAGADDDDFGWQSHAWFSIALLKDSRK